jgi:hypothetical protein
VEDEGVDGGEHPSEVGSVPRVGEGGNGGMNSRAV